MWILSGRTRGRVTFNCLLIVLFDFLSYVSRSLPKEGETIHGTKFATGFGGKGCNQVVAAQKLGSKTAILCKLGDDSWGRDYRGHLERLGVETKFIETLAGESTGIAQICVSSETGANHIVIVVGANNRLAPGDVEESVELLNRSKVLLCQLETPIAGTVRALELMKHGISILNAAPGLRDLPESLLTLPTIFCVNESEAELITGISVSSVAEAKKALLCLRAMGCRTVIITLGGDGAVFQGEQPNSPVCHVRVPKVDNVVDTTGAGDCFLGALAHHLARDNGLGNIKECIGRACLIASVSVQRLGTQSSFPTGEEVHTLNTGLDIIEI